MAVETTIANMALNRLGVSEKIEDLDAQTHLSRTCKFWLPICRLQVLRDFPWGFANRSEALALASEEAHPGWTYAYQYPQGTAAVRAVADENGMRYAYVAYNWPAAWNVTPVFARFPWKLSIKADGASQIILSDVPNAYAFHTADVTNYNVWPADAQSTLAWNLAMEIAGPVKAAAEFANRATNMYEGMRLRAAANSMNEARDDQEPDSPAIRARD